ncbi:hypothetical protein [Flavobacterium sp. FlaQc-30]|uniref:hypothetical protein n=1 Tax=Flavobacterium sp. FlaQc-30 TaxID=3374179 RepID=UPI0037578FBC
MIIKKYFSDFFNDWRKPILLWIISIFLLIVSNFFKNPIFENICFTVFGLGLLFLLIFAFYQLLQKKWLKSIGTFFLLGGTIVAFSFYMIILFFIEQNTPDTWADNLTIPKNIPINNPIDLDYHANFESQRPDSITNKVVTKTEFQLYNSFQPGLYEYDFWIGKIENGIIYLKAFEITQNESLSVKELKKRSSIKISNPSNNIKKFGTVGDFTIYEGDWGKPYAARFEVWFKPDNGEKERKLFSKNYKIEGWMR